MKPYPGHRAPRHSQKVARPLVCEPLEPRYALHSVAIQWSFHELDQLDLADARPDIAALASTSTANSTANSVVTLEPTELVAHDDLNDLNDLDELVGEGEGDNDGTLSAPRESHSAPRANGSIGLTVTHLAGGPQPNPISLNLPLTLPLTKPLPPALTSPWATNLPGRGTFASSPDLPAQTGASSLLPSPANSLTLVGAGNSLPLGSQYAQAVPSNSAIVSSSARPFASQRPEASVSPVLGQASATVGTPIRPDAQAATLALFKQSTASYFDARSLGTAHAGASNLRDGLIEANGNSTISSDMGNSSQSPVLSELRAAVESLAHQRSAQRQAASTKATETGWDSSLAIDALARAHREVIHDNGLLQLATTPERMSNISSLEAYAAIEQVEAQSRSIQLIKVGMVREFDLAGQHLGSLTLASDPARMVTQVPDEAIAAIDAWHANSVSTQESLETITDAENSVLNRSLLPLSFFAVAGLLLRSRQKFRQAADQAKARRWRWPVR